MTFVLSVAQGTVLVISLICIEWAQALPERVTLDLKALWRPGQGTEERNPGHKGLGPLPGIVG